MDALHVPCLRSDLFSLRAMDTLRGGFHGRNGGISIFFGQLTFPFWGSVAFDWHTHHEKHVISLFGTVNCASSCWEEWC